MKRALLLLALVAALTGVVGVRPADGQVKSEPSFAGNLHPASENTSNEPRPVRNDVAQPGEEIVTLRYFKIKKGTFPEFLKASQEGVWPYFEKIGSRVVGMWQVIHPPVDTVKDSPDYDEVYLMTRYSSVEHWAATRDPQKLGGNGPDWDACKRALALRDSLTIESRVSFLKGDTRNSPPLFMPGLAETFAPAAPH
jgi:hypothetical protein